MTDTAYQKLYWGDFDLYVDLGYSSELTDKDNVFLDMISIKFEGMLYGRDPDPTHRLLEMIAYSKSWAPGPSLMDNNVIYALATFVYGLDCCFLFNIEVHHGTTKWTEIGGSLQRFVDSIREVVYEMEPRR